MNPRKEIHRHEVDLVAADIVNAMRQRSAKFPTPDERYGIGQGACIAATGWTLGLMLQIVENKGMTPDPDALADALWLQVRPYIVKAAKLQQEGKP